MNFADKLMSAVERKNSPCVVGLDPMVELFPPHLIPDTGQYRDERQAVAEAIIRFNMQIIDAVYDLAPAVKPQLAFYEVYGYHGIRAFEETCRYAGEKGLIVIADAKRNDIGSTAAAYARAYFNEGISVDALTVNGYLGSDGVLPFVEHCGENGKGIFILVKTSNSSSGQIQDLPAGGKKLHEIVAALVNEWGQNCVGDYGFSSVGAVVGANYPAEMKYLREMMPKAVFLLPGFGAQGGTAEDARHAFVCGRGAVVSASRSILYAYRSEKWSRHFKPQEFCQAARAELEDMKKKINQYRLDAG